MIDLHAKFDLFLSSEETCILFTVAFRGRVLFALTTDSH